MNDIKKAVLGTLSFIICVCLMSFVIVEPYFTYCLLGNTVYYQDAPLRKKMAGSLDVLVVGASQAVRAFDPAVLDEELKVNSYNLAVPSMSMDSRYFILEKEIQRNDVSTVVIEIAYDTLKRDRKEEGPEGILRTL